MSLNPTLEEQEAFAQTQESFRSTMLARELLVATSLTATYLLVAVWVWLVSAPYGVPVVATAACALVLVLSTKVRIDTPLGFTAPIQLAFLPLLLVAPIALVAPVTLASLLIAALPTVVRGELPGSRLWQHSANAWFAIGPVAVLTIAGVSGRQASAPLLIGALVAQFAVDFAVSGVRFLATRGLTLSAHLRASWVYAVDAGFSGVGWGIGELTQTRPLWVLVLVPLLGILAMLARERHKRFEAVLELSTAYRGTALVLGDVVEADDGYTGRHCKSVVALVAAVGEKLDLNAERRRNLEFAALLHDVGKIAVPKEIINKPGRLNAEEWRVIRTHTVEGQSMLNRVGGFMKDVGRIVRSHHERWDGGGYPDGLVGEEIPLESRIISCCDTWNAMRTDRVYRKALSYDAAVTELLANSGSQLDPLIVGVLLEVIRAEQDSLEAADALPAPNGAVAIATRA